MTQLRDPDAIIAAWLEDGPDRLPGETRRAIAVGLRTQPRDRRMAILGGSTMLPLSRLATAAGLAAVIGVVAILALANRGAGPAAQPSSSAGPTATVAPSASPVGTPQASASPAATVLPPLDTAGWIPFVSSRYRYGISYPPTDWTAIPGDRDWTLARDLDVDSTAPDRFETQGAADGLGIRLSVWSVTIPPGTTLEGWMESYCVAEGLPPCAEVTDLPAGATPSGPTRILGWRNRAHEPMAAFLSPAGTTVHVAAIWRTENDPAVLPWGGSKRLLAAFLSTITMPKVPEGSPAAS